MNELRQDVVYAARQLVRTPAFTVVTLLILAFGIGANTAIFTLVDSLLFQQLPISAPDQLRRFEWRSAQPTFVRRYSGTESGGYRSSFSYPHFQYLRARTRTFSDVFCFSLPLAVNATIGQNKQLIKGHVVSGNYFRGLGVSAALGRLLTDDDDRSAAAPVAVVSHGFWKRALGSDAGAVGRPIVVNGISTTVVGVTARSFHGVIPGASVDIMMPAAMHGVVTAEPGVLRQSGDWQFIVIGRLPKGVVDDQARVELETLLRQAIVAEAPQASYELPQARLVSGSRGAGLMMAQDALPPLLALFGVVIFVLLIACANLTGMLGARASARAREIGTRLVLGASRRRLMRQLLTESVLLSTIGGVVGISFAYVFVAVIPSALALLGSEELTIVASPNIRVLAFAVGLCVLTGIVFGLAPALRTTRLDLVSMLKVTFGVSGHKRFSLGKTLITMQVALSFVLLVCAGLAARNLSGMHKASPGFETENILLFKASPGLNGLKEEPLLGFYEEALRRIRLNPDVLSATASYSTILSNGSISYQIPVRRDDGSVRELRVRIQPVAPGYFETMGIPMLLGADFTWNHREGSRQVAVINQALANEIFPGKHPVGQSFGPGSDRQIVGVVGNVKHSLIQGPQPTIYMPYRQQMPLNSMLFAVRTAGEPTDVLPDIYRVFSSLDSNLPLSEIRTQAAQVGEFVAPHGVMATLLGLFGVVSLLLACLGIYGTLSYNTTRRTPEIGVRMALGARRSSVVLAIAGECLVPVAVGIVLGLFGALAVSKTLQFMFFGVSSADPVAVGVAAFFMLFGAMLAAFLPARRASRIDPMKALRYE